MTELTYDKGRIWFPQDPLKIDLNFFVPPRVYVDELRFKHDDLGIAVRIHPYYLPIGLESGQAIDKQIIEPSIDLVVRDLEPAVKLFEQLRELARSGITPDSMKYERSPSGDNFKVFDFSARHQGRPFGALLRIQKSDQLSLQHEYIDSIPVAGIVHQDPRKVAHVEGKTLKDAIERVISMYNIDHRLKDVPTN